MELNWDMVYLRSDDETVSETDPLWVRVALPASFKRRMDEARWGLAYEGLFSQKL